MLKDFSQQFEKQPTNIYFLAKNYSTNKYLIEFTKSLDSTFYRVPHLALNDEEGITPQIAKFLYSKGYSVNRFRILNRETDVHFSFKDSTPGETHDNICVYAEVDVINGHNPNIKETSLKDLLELLETSPVYDPCISTSIRLLSDD